MVRRASPAWWGQAAAEGLQTAGVPLFSRLGFSQAGHAISFLPEAAFAEQFDALAAFEDIAFGAER
jgi:hypothetical protein